MGIKFSKKKANNENSHHELYMKDVGNFPNLNRIDKGLLR